VEEEDNSDMVHADNTQPTDEEDEQASTSTEHTIQSHVQTSKFTCITDQPYSY
jgi:hypothetical protein